MARKKTNKGFDPKVLIPLFEQVGTEKGIGKEKVCEIISRCFEITCQKKIEYKLKASLNTQFKSFKSNPNDVKLEPAKIKVEINTETGDLYLARLFEVRKDEDIDDDYLQIADDDPKVVESGKKVGEYYEVPIDVSTFDLSDATRFKNEYLSEISKAVKENLLEQFKDKVGTLVNANVETCDNHSVIVNFSFGSSNTTTTMYERDLIGNEKFQAGDKIKVYVVGVGKEAGGKKGSDQLVKVSRSCNEFLAKLFENEIHEIYDGTISIVDVKRWPGLRAKVVVKSDDTNVDPSGACIGPNGARIQQIVSQLGNSKDSKENVDVVTYRENRELYLAECLTPKTDLIEGVRIDEDEKVAYIIVLSDETKPVLIGKKACNLVLAEKLLGLEKINILTLEDAIEEKIEYHTISELENIERDIERRKTREQALKNAKEKLKNEILPTQSNVKDEEISIEEETQSEDISPVISDETNDIKNVSETEKKAVEEESANTTIEKTEVKEKEIPVEQVDVKTTISINDLEASLEAEKRAKLQANNKKKNKKKAEEKSQVKKEDKKEVKKMDIYTKEELEDLEDEDSYEYEDEEDFSEYDDDSYYEDN